MYSSKRISQFYQIRGQWDSVDKSFVDYVNSGMALVQSEKRFFDAKSEDELCGDKAIDVMFLEKAFLNGGLIYLFSQLEYYLHFAKREISRLLGKEDNTKFTRNIIKNEVKHIFSFRGETIDSIPSLNEKWKVILLYRDIRNVFVHDNGITDKPEVFYNIIFNNRISSLVTCILSYYQRTEICITKDFVLQVCKDITLFFNELLDHFDTRC